MTAPPFTPASWWKIAVPLLIAAVIALIVASEVSYRRSAGASASLERLMENRIAVQHLKELAVDAETHQRGYLLTGKESYLAPYKASITEIEATFDFLRTRFAGDSEQLAALVKISRPLARKMGEMDMAIELRTSNKEIAWRSVLETDFGQHYMVTMRASAEALTQRINTAILAEQNHIHETFIISRFTIGAAALLSLLAFWLYRRQARRLVAAELTIKEQLRQEQTVLEAEVIARTAELSMLANHLETAREDERAHLARELHDELGALLTAAKLDVARLRSRVALEATDLSERIVHLNQTLNEGIALKRRIIEGLRPSSLTNLGLLPTLEILVRESAARSAISIETHFEEAAMSPSVELTAYRFVQEALTNIMKHSAAKHVLITLHAFPHHVELSVSDDGVGFAAEKIKAFSYGLSGMRQRVIASGGKLVINSESGVGTRITVTLPRTANATLT